jgi:hypothetical protein
MCYSTHCHVAAVKILVHFGLYFSSNGQLKKFLFSVTGPILNFLAWWPSWLEFGINGHNFGRGPYKYLSTNVWLQLAQWFLRRFMLTMYDGRQVMAKACVAFGQVS